MSKSERHEQFYSTVHSMLEGVAGLTPERRDEKLKQLFANYGPQLNGCLVRKFRVSDDDAADVVQEFLLKRFLTPAPEQNVAGKRPGKPFLPGSVVLSPVNSGLWAFSGEVSYERTGAGLA